MYLIHLMINFFFDVGHQSYAHKILTGRASQFPMLKKYGGLCGFQNRQESIYDPWEAGHSSTTISGATGLALARDLKKEKFEVVSVIGDAALMSGESLEALNFLGGIDTKVIVILNDNNMSISRNVGGLSNFYLMLECHINITKLKIIILKSFHNLLWDRKYLMLLRRLRIR